MKKGQKKSSKKQVLRYSESFKQRVVSEIEKGSLTIKESRIKYDIRGGSTIQNWIRKFGKNHLLCRVVKIQTPQEVDSEKLLKQRVAELEKALAQTQLAFLKSESYLKVACEHLGMEVDKFKKKQTTKPSHSDPQGSTTTPTE